MTDDHFPVITGIGAISAGGKNVQELWQSALAGRAKSSFKILKENNFQIPIYAAPSPCFSGNDQRLVRRADRSAALALAAAREAWNQSGITFSGNEASRVGVIIGSSRGPASFYERAVLATETYPSAPVYGTFSSIAGVVSDALLTEGSASMVSSTCTSGATALQLGAQMIRSGVLDAVVIGGVEAPLVDFVLKQYLAAGVLSKDNYLRPFDSRRSGTILGEGAAFLVLESKIFAKQRQASVLAELQAVHLRSYPGQRASLDHEGVSLQKVIHAALQDAALLPSDIDLLHLHGTATLLNDLIESHAIEAIFGEIERQPISWATKGITGHTLGASSLFQVVLSIQAMRDSLIPKTVQFTHRDSACRICLHQEVPLAQSSQHTLCLTSGFWGNVAAIILKK